MRLVCPSCGAVASMEAWQNDATFRYFAEALCKLPAPVMKNTLSYLGLFRQGNRALPWRRALKIVHGLKEIVEQETVHWDGGETRPITAEIWGNAIEATLARNPKGLKNHNYLRHVAYELAAGLASKKEKQREDARRKRGGEDIDTEYMPLSADLKKQIERLTK